MAKRYCYQFRTAKSTKKQCTSKLSSCFSSKNTVHFMVQDSGTWRSGNKKGFDALERRVPAIKKGLMPWNVAFQYFIYPCPVPTRAFRPRPTTTGTPTDRKHTLIFIVPLPHANTQG